MEVWDWLVPWWNWWAGFTDLFDWTAMAALGTVGAVAVALNQAGRAARVEARHGAGLLDHVRSLIQPIVDATGILHCSDISADAANEVLRQGLIERALEGLDRIPPKDAGAHGISDYLVGIRTALHAAKEEFPELKDGVFPSSRWLDGQIWYLGSAAKEMARRRDILLKGWLAVALTDLRADLARRWFFRRR